MAIFEITLLFLGSIIGAGFATGAEIVTFFGNLNLPVWSIALIVGICMLLVITLEIYLFYPSKPIEINFALNSKKSFNQNPNFTKFLHIVIIMIYLILFTAMTAGITQITNINFCIISLIISTCIVLFGIQHLSRFNTVIVSIIIVLIITTAFPHLQSTTIDITNHNKSTIYSAIFWAFLYAGLNCFIFPELITASAQKHQRCTLLWAGLFTAISVTILVGLILSTISTSNTQSMSIPLLAATPNSLTVAIILLAILTSQYTALFAITQQLQKLIPQTKHKPLTTMFCVCICTLIISFCGFTQIIQFGYPLIGAFTCFYLLISFLTKFWQHLHYHQH